MGERKRRGGKQICLRGGGELKGWWLGGHENVNLDVSEAIYSSLGIQRVCVCGGWVDSI